MPAPGLYLLIDSWNDWWKWETLFHLSHVSDDGKVTSVGYVKFGSAALESGTPPLPDSFEQLDDEFFSLGQDRDYYENLSSLGGSIRDQVLQALKDVAFDTSLFDAHRSEPVMGNSLLRNVPPSVVVGQFARLSHGGVPLTAYSFLYRAPDSSRLQGGRRRPKSTSGSNLELAFEVQPESFPPTNLHVLIGRNGAGKTTLLNAMCRSLILGDPDEHGSFEGTSDGEGLFANLVSVTFSAFDPFTPLQDRRDRSEGMRYSYIGLKRRSGPVDDRQAPKTPEQLSADFAQSALNCSSGPKLDRWSRALDVLEADPLFAEANVSDLTAFADSPEDLRSAAHKLFGRLSSGHKIVLLTITRLVETVEEKTLVLLDEPEAHLHPPLLSAFTRALSDLLIDRNGVGIVATHSPVILQEVPRRCVYIIRRKGTVVKAKPPREETFGENVGKLTRDVFGLEVTASGFHRLIREEVEDGRSALEIVEKFKGEVGWEARALIDALVDTRDARSTSSGVGEAP
ncbi:AAA family ATPase [Frigoribacterium sp. R86507]|uniref:AAA family ATPase n=1 Tax=Frigoribacterium sp. R86507 TaxID=3093850 RepID=UPI0037C7AFBF